MNIRKIIDSVFKRIFTISGFATSAVILLIIVFLFSEGAGLFHARIIEDGYVLAINKGNPVNELNAVQIKEIFDGDITNWEKAGGDNRNIEVFRLEHLDKMFTEVTMFAIGTPTFRKKRRQDVAQSQWGLSAPSRRLPPSVFHSIL